MIKSDYGMRALLQPFLWLLSCTHI